VTRSDDGFATDTSIPFTKLFLLRVIVAVTFSPGAVYGMKAFLPACDSGEVIVPTKLPPDARLVMETAISWGILFTSFMVETVSLMALVRKVEGVISRSCSG
jgi:hypothetical protein